MSSVVKAKGNMYSWVTHIWSPGKGCSHQCTYCYARQSAQRFGRDFPDKFILDPCFPNLGQDKAIFVGHMCDMWAKDVADEDIYKVLEHCGRHRLNEYIFQSKNPASFLNYSELGHLQTTLGTTIETNRQTILDEVSKAPPVSERATALKELRGCVWKRFVTIEPIMDFDVTELWELIVFASPDFVNIGADSKKQRLPEPSAEKITALLECLRESKIEVREKHNLERLMKP